MNGWMYALTAYSLVKILTENVTTCAVAEFKGSYAGFLMPEVVYFLSLQ